MKSLAMRLIIALMAALVLKPASVEAVDVIAPAWAYQVRIGMRLAELRTVSGKRYFGVTIEAIDQQQIQFTHQQGRNVEFLVSIIDPNTYSTAQTPRPNGGGQRIVAGPLAAMMTAHDRSVTGVDKLDYHEQAVLKRWLDQMSTQFPASIGGSQKLERQEQVALVSWLNQKRNAMNQGQGLEAPEVPIQLPVNSWISGADFTGFQQWRVFHLGNGQNWQQIDQNSTQFYRDASGRPIKIHIRASGSNFLMKVEGAGEIFVKPVR